MASITTFIRNTPAEALRDYFDATGIRLPALDWEAPEQEMVKPLLQAVDKMDDEGRARVVADAERVSRMADEPGQVALMSVADDRKHLESLANGHARALWMFLKEPVDFRHAEEVRYTDEKRRGRSWDGFLGKADCSVQSDEASLEAFKTSLRHRFGTTNVHVDIFERVRPTFEGVDCELIQIAIYREGLPDALLAFD